MKILKLTIQAVVASLSVVSAPLLAQPAEATTVTWSVSSLAAGTSTMLGSVTPTVANSLISFTVSPGYTSGACHLGFTWTDSRGTFWDGITKLNSSLPLTVTPPGAPYPEYWGPNVVGGFTQGGPDRLGQPVTFFLDASPSTACSSFSITVTYT